MIFAASIIFGIIGIAVIFAGLYVSHSKDDGCFDLDAYRRGEGR